MWSFLYDALNEFQASPAEVTLMQLFRIIRVLHVDHHAKLLTLLPVYLGFRTVTELRFEGIIRIRSTRPNRTRQHPRHI